MKNKVYAIFLTTLSLALACLLLWAGGQLAKYLIPDLNNTASYLVGLLLIVSTALSLLLSYLLSKSIYEYWFLIMERMAKALFRRKLNDISTRLFWGKSRWEAEWLYWRQPYSDKWYRCNKKDLNSLYLQLPQVLLRIDPLDDGQWAEIGHPLRADFIEEHTSIEIIK